MTPIHEYTGLLADVKTALIAAGWREDELFRRVSAAAAGESGILAELAEVKRELGETRKELAIEVQRRVNAERFLSGKGAAL